MDNTKELEITSLVVHLMEFREYWNAHENLNGSIDGLSLIQEDGTVLGSLVRIVDGEINMSNA